jgi:hypothetical protein
MELRKLLKSDEKIFLTTCAKCLTVDYAVSFKNPETIKKMIKFFGFKILSEKILPFEALSLNKIKENKITVNFSAIIQHA